MKVDILCLLPLIDSCHQVVTQLWDRVKVTWHVGNVFAVVREFRVGSYSFWFGKFLANP